MKFSANGIALLKQLEGVKYKAYKSTKSDPWTIGVGHTGPEVTANTVWDEAQVNAAIKADIAEAERCINLSVRCHLNQNQYDALVIFVFNVGVTAFANSSMRRNLNAKDYEGTSAQFGRWNKQFNTNTGKYDVITGLTNRRAAEQKLFDTPMAGDNGAKVQP